MAPSDSPHQTLAAEQKGFDAVNTIHAEPNDLELPNREKIGTFQDQRDMERIGKEQVFKVKHGLVLYSDRNC